MTGNPKIPKSKIWRLEEPFPDNKDQEMEQNQTDDSGDPNYRWESYFVLESRCLPMNYTHTRSMQLRSHRLMIPHALHITIGNDQLALLSRISHSRHSPMQVDSASGFCVIGSPGNVANIVVTSSEGCERTPVPSSQLVHQVSPSDGSGTPPVPTQLRFNNGAQPNPFLKFSSASLYSSSRLEYTIGSFDGDEIAARALPGCAGVLPGGPFRCGRLQSIPPRLGRIGVFQSHTGKLSASEDVTCRFFR